MKKGLAIFILFTLLNSWSALAAQLTEPTDCPYETNATVKVLPGDGGKTDDGDGDKNQSKDANTG